MNKIEYLKVLHELKVGITTPEQFADLEKRIYATCDSIEDELNIKRGGSHE